MVKVTLKFDIDLHVTRELRIRCCKGEEMERNLNNLLRMRNHTMHQEWHQAFILEAKETKFTVIIAAFQNRYTNVNSETPLIFKK